MGRDITELSNIEFRGSLTEATAAYSTTARRLLTSLSTELELAAGDSEAAMSTLSGHWYWFGRDTRAKAKSVAARLRRAQEQTDAAARQAGRFGAAYRTHFVAAASKERAAAAAKQGGS